MECQELSEMMSARLDGGLAPAEERLLEEHLASCSACREQWRRFVAVDAVLSAASMVSAPAALSADVLARLDRRLRIRRGLVGGLGLALGSAAVAAAVIVPLGLQLVGLLGIAPALIEGLPETAAHILPSIGAAGRAATLVAGEIILPLVVAGLCCLVALMVANAVWLGAVRRLRATK
jgi:anti-sigma factor RsiW